MRLVGYDYSSEGAYYITICTRDRECTLGDIVNDQIMLSQIGQYVGECWRAIQDDFSNVVLDEYTIMPNHIHGIVIISYKCAMELVTGKAATNLTPTADPATDLIQEEPVRDLTEDGGPVRDLINQIPPQDQIPPHNQIPLGLVYAKSSGKIDWPLMKNPKQTLGKVIRHFKARATKTVHDAGLHDFRWQRGYHDHIIRNEHELERVRIYIRNNPKHWRTRSGVPGCSAKLPAPT